jgi:hypothetical protein
MVFENGLEVDVREKRKEVQSYPTIMFGFWWM